MNVIEFSYDTCHGFAWMYVPSNTEAILIVQCCLVQDKKLYEEAGKVKYLKKIQAKDCGHDWGLCGDANEKAFDYWGENRCMKALFNHAERHGIEIV